MKSKSEQELEKYNETHQRCPFFLECSAAEDEGWCHAFDPQRDNVSIKPKCFK